MKPIVSLRGKFEMVRSLRIAVVVYLLVIHGICLSQPPAEADNVQPLGDEECPVARYSYCGLVPDETNYLIQAADQNRDTSITEIDELLTDNFRAYNETYGGLHTFWADDIISNLICDVQQLAYKWSWEFTIKHIRIILPVLASVFVLFFLRTTRWKSARSSSITTLGVGLGVSIFLVGLTLGPLFVAPEFELLKTRFWLEDVEYLLRSRPFG